MLTQRGGKWEILNSWWIILTFGILFLNWIAFLYIGITAKKTKWILWSILYFLPLGIIVTGVVEGRPEDALMGLLIVSTGFIGIIHSFIAREEYLIRLDIVCKSRSKKEHVGELRAKAARELGVNESATTQDKEAKQTVKRVRPIDYILNRTDDDMEAIDSSHRELEKINRSISKGAAAGIIIGTVTLILILLSAVSGQYYGVSMIALIDVAIVYALAYGINMKSRVCAVLLAVEYVASRIVFILDSPMAFSTILSLVITILLSILIYEGVRGTFEYHKFINTPKEIEKEDE